MKKIAITGTIGSGKSTVCQMIRELGYPVFDCDKASFELSMPQKEAWKKIAEHFDGILLENQEINRKKLASIIFQDEVAKKKLESILHPAILAKMQDEINKSSTLFLAEVPTLYESGWEIYFDDVLVVTVSDKIREERLIQNRSMTVEQINERKNAQIHDKIKLEKATWIIENNGSKEELKENVKEWLDHLERGISCR